MKKLVKWIFRLGVLGLVAGLIGLGALWYAYGRDLPDVETRLHHFTTSGTWHMSEQLSLRLDYQYYRYNSDDYIYTGSAASIDKVLTLGERNPNEQIHYVGASAVYRWQ